MFCENTGVLTKANAPSKFPSHFFMILLLSTALASLPRFPCRIEMAFKLCKCRDAERQAGSKSPQGSSQQGPSSSNRENASIKTLVILPRLSINQSIHTRSCTQYYEQTQGGGVYVKL